MYFLLLWFVGLLTGCMGERKCPSALSGCQLPCSWEVFGGGSGNGRDLKRESLTALNWVKKIERSLAAVVGRGKISPVASADYLRALSEVSPQKVLAERLMANWEETLRSLKNQQTLWMFTQAGKPNRNHQYAAM